MKNKVEELSKILADRYGHGMAEKCVTQAEVALEVLGDRITQLAKDYNEVARDNRYMSLRTSELLCELAETKELVERLEQERDALKAHCEGYHHLCNILYMSVHVSEIKSLSAPVRDLWLAGQADFAAKERGDLPDFRLNEIQAQAIEDAAGKVCQLWAGVKDGHALSMCEYSELIEHAKQLLEDT